MGGGHGYLSRQYGLTVDNLLEVDMVLADGRFVTASEDENEDLFWAVRGGGNFGVVTSFLFRAHPVDTVYGGPIIWPIDQAEQILRWYRDFIKDASEDLYGWFGFHRVPTGSPLPEELHGAHGCVITWCYTGCTENEEVTVAVTVTQSATGVVATGQWQGTCTGQLQHWVADAAVVTGDAFDAGPAEVYGVATTRSEGTVTATDEWCPEDGLTLIWRAYVPAILNRSEQ